ncbi:hypothetical protein DFJ58DRAFT_828961 [Suillus subalutaceus]|uniref:uncharacterized protein n=1 Tax=Suillus subalutaceus TaxID=48586 RepID=UPI001B87AED4|nr:uncharacterized protein DFJ58DRAFT_828961 [Suillus subalutaceus]KAG1826496.1 hypothetical protein DFJ58DRAFT_828961 [Suillus subalutaceus]
MIADRSGGEPCLEDLYICSYPPTISALIRGRQMMKTHATPSFATIGQSQPGARQGRVLPAVNRELKLVHRLVPPPMSSSPISLATRVWRAHMNANSGFCK